MRKTTIPELIRQVRKTYNGAAWHGPNIVETLANVTPEQAVKRLGASNNIAELVHHIYAWRVFIIKRFSDGQDFEVNDEFNFIKLDSVDELIWEKLKQQLAESQEQLIVVMQNFDPKKLSNQVINRNYTYLDLLHGIIHHDLYHLGQIALLKK